jgi:MtaA/CmuA family methyltransferase
MQEMTAVERCETVLAGAIPDRVPVGLLNFMPAAAALGMTMREYCTDGDAMAEAHVVAWERHGHDLIDLENGVAALASAVGCQVEFEGDTAPPWVTGPAIERIEDVDKLRPIDPTADGMLPELLKATRAIAERVDDGAFLLAEADQGPFSLATQIVGIEELLIAVMEPSKEPYLARLLEYTTEQVIAYGRALMEAGAHMTGMGESIAGPDVCSPDVYRRWALPYERVVVDTLAADGWRIALHICGDATRIVEDMVATHSQLLEVDYKVDLAAVKAGIRGKTAVMGTVDPSAVLTLGTPEEVREAARQDIRVLGAGGGFILSPGCALPYETPDENIAALVDAARAEGRYATELGSFGP